VFTVFLLTFPAGLFMYWITSNLVTLVQNYVIYNHGPGRKPPEERVKSGGSGHAGGSSRGGNGVRSPRDGSGSKSGDINGQASPSEESAVAQAAKQGKRKRRRKKKR
jgi:YidC/Oxa1 family membrane protein insertase